MSTQKYSILFFILFFFSCEDKKSLVSTDEVFFPDRITKNAELTQKDSGQVKFKLISPLIEEYTLIDTPYVIFRKGLKIRFHTKEEKPSSLKADWAKVIELKGLYHVVGNVLVVNSDNDTLKTDTLFWNKNKKRIFTTDTVRINRADGSFLIANDGLNASEDLKEYILLKNKGEINFQKDKL